MFTHPYLKIEILENKQLAHRKTASTWLKKLSDSGILLQEKKGRTIYFINHKLVGFSLRIEIFSHFFHQALTSDQSHLTKSLQM